MDTILHSFNDRFEAIHDRSVDLIKTVGDAELYRTAREIEGSMIHLSCGAYILRSAAAVEQTCGGIMTRLWDDPFEWTLPEKLSTSGAVLEYLNEVETTRVSAFRYFASDADLQKTIPAPERIRPIVDVLLETVARAEHFQGRAFALAQLFSDRKLPRV